MDRATSQKRKRDDAAFTEAVPLFDATTGKGKASLKNRIRSLRRLLTRPELPRTLRTDKKRMLRRLEEQQAEKTVEAREKRYFDKYKQIKFHETRKAERKLRRAQRALTAAGQVEGASVLVTGDSPELALAAVAAARADVDYIKWFPRHLKYVALYAKAVSEDVKLEARRAALRRWAQANAAARVFLPTPPAADSGVDFGPALPVLNSRVQGEEVDEEEEEEEAEVDSDEDSDSNSDEDISSEDDQDAEELVEGGGVRKGGPPAARAPKKVEVDKDKGIETGKGVGMQKASMKAAEVPAQPEPSRKRQRQESSVAVKGPGTGEGEREGTGASSSGTSGKAGVGTGKPRPGAAVASTDGILLPTRPVARKTGAAKKAELLSRTIAAGGLAPCDEDTAEPDEDAQADIALDPFFSAGSASGSELPAFIAEAWPADDEMDESAAERESAGYGFGVKGVWGPAGAAARWEREHMGVARYKASEYARRPTGGAGATGNAAGPIRDLSHLAGRKLKRAERAQAFSARKAEAGSGALIPGSGRFSETFYGTERDPGARMVHETRMASADRSREKAQAKANEAWGQGQGGAGGRGPRFGVPRPIPSAALGSGQRAREAKPQALRVPAENKPQSQGKGGHLKFIE